MASLLPAPASQKPVVAGKGGKVPCNQTAIAVWGTLQIKGHQHEPYDESHDESQH